MNKLTTEQLLFAHRIGATYFTINHRIPKKIYNGNWFYYEEGWYASHITNSANEESCEPIDFTPLYNQWIDHDGGECPVGDDDEVVVEFNDIHDGAPLFFSSTDSVNWNDVERFKLHRSEEDNWPEQRADAIGHGEHYETTPEASDGSTASKYHREISPGVWVDVYDVLKAWRVENPALQHLIKKALQPGELGHKTIDQDMDDIIASAKRAKELI